jgi:hypothetical protein
MELRKDASLLLSSILRIERYVASAIVLLNIASSKSSIVTSSGVVSDVSAVATSLKTVGLAGAAKLPEIACKNIFKPLHRPAGLGHH